MKGIWKLLGIGFGLSILFAGCSSTQTENALIQNVKSDELKDVEAVVTSNNRDALPVLLNQIDRVSVITPDGSEINLELGTWFDNLKDKLYQLQPTNVSIIDHPYTLVLWYQNGNPFIIQIGEEGIHIGNKTYTSSEITQIVQEIEQELGQQFVRNLVIDQIAFQSKDVELGSFEVSETQQNQLIREIKNATYLDQPPRIQYPIFPNYYVQLMVDKSVLNLDIIGENFIGITLGSNQYLYYEVNQNIYQMVHDLLPPLEFSEDNPKSLFRATAVEIISTNLASSIKIGDIGMESIQAESITDSFVRLLVEGVEQEQKPDQDALVELYFIDNKNKKKVLVYADGYLYNDTYYNTPGIGERIQTHIQNFIR